MVQARIEIDHRAVSDKLEAMARRARNLTPAYAVFGDYLVRETEGRFASETAPDGTRWAALSKGYAATKKGPKILTEKHFLRQSINRQAESRMLKVGTPVAYAAMHQLGLKKALSIPAHRRKVKSRSGKGRSGVAFVSAHTRKVSIQARPFLGMNDADREELRETVKEYLFS